MITKEFAISFAEEWIKSWNSHNLEKILSHYTDDFTIETPMAAKIFPETGGIVRGKEAVRAYWTIGLEKIPDLKFELLDVLIGINGLTIYYRNTATNKKSVEIMIFNDQLKVGKAIVHYAE
jgi:ketosteroid isomerase-like protein